MKVLIADDDPISLRVLRAMVKKLGYDCLLANDGGAAWRSFVDDAPNVIISDWMMPEIDGPELCTRIRGCGLHYTYFIFLTAYGDRTHYIEGMRLGADDYLSKPVDPAELEVRLLSAQRITLLHRRLQEQREMLERLNRELFEQSRHDPLTGLGNRLRLREDLAQLGARAERYGHSYSVALCDIDHFKLFNDRYGHVAGDDALRTVAAALQAQCRAGDALYRFGGEEFLVIFPEQTVESALVALERMRRAVEALQITHCTRPAPCVLTISGGLTELRPGQASSFHSVLREADAALYRSKASGRNRVAAFDSSVDSQASTLPPDWDWNDPATAPLGLSRGSWDAGLI